MKEDNQATLRHLQEALRAAENKFSIIFGMIPDPTTITDITTGTIMDLNEAAATWFGRSRQEAIGRTTAEVMVWADFSDRERMLQEIRSKGEINDMEFRLRKHDGELRHVLFSSRLIQIEGKPCLLSRAQDITRQKQTEAALRDSEARMRSIVESNPVGMHMYRLEPDGRLIFTGANPAADTILGLDNRIFIGKTIEEAFPGLKDSEVPQRYREVALTAVGWKTENIIYQDDAISGVFEVHAFQTGPNHMVAAFEDITERKRVEEALRQSEERFRNLTESLPLTIFEIDLQGRFTYVNHAALEKFGYSQADFDNGVNILQALAPADRQRAQEAIARRLSGIVDGYIEYEGLKKDGTTFPVTVASTPIMREGRPVGLRGIVVDLSERKQLEEERLKSQKLESIGTLAGGIAHDFNNLLQGIFGYISLAKVTLDQKQKALSMLEQAEKALHTTVNLTSQLLTFSKGGKPIKKMITLQHPLENAVKFALSGSHSDYRLDIASGLWPVEADEGQLTQVFQNIVLNANEAMANSETVKIRARNVDLPVSANLAFPQGGRYVRIDISDSGTGISEKNMAKIFDPYFTTKQKGSGLGLATSYSIIKNHGGEIEVHSELHKGTTFTIYLPAAQGDERVETPGTLPKTGAKKGRILLMDDEDMVRKIAAEMLAILGHEVECAAEGRSTIELFQQAKESGKPFDLLILDLTVKGGMGGEEALQKIRQIDPDVTAVVSSGYAENQVVAHFKDYGFAAFLNKPYDLAALKQCLHRLLPDVKRG